MSPNMPGTAGSEELSAYYADRRLLWRNVALIVLLGIGWSAVYTYVSPLVTLRLKSQGVSNATLGFIGGVNSWIYSYLVMYFAWKSDHTVSGFGRRIPFLMISAPVIITAITLVPVFAAPWILVGLWMTQSIFMDIKAATIPLLNIDCVPRHMLARIYSLGGIACGVVNFFALRYGMTLADHSLVAPYWLGAGLLSLTTLVGVFLIKEPPVKVVKAGRFVPWSTFKVALQDRRMVILMAGVGLIQVGWMVCMSWLWLYANKTLGLSRESLGGIISWSLLVPLVISLPVGWFIDRYRGFRVVVIYWALVTASICWLVFKVHDGLTLGLATIFLAFTAPFYGGIDIKVYRECDPRDVGSFTSTNSCIRAVIIGSCVSISGVLVERWGGDYRAGFVFGGLMTTLGLICMFFHYRLMKNPQRMAAGDKSFPTASPVQSVSTAGRGPIEVKIHGSPSAVLAFKKFFS